MHENDVERLADFESEYNAQLEQDCIPQPSEWERLIAARLARERAADRARAENPQPREPWTGDPMTPLYMRPPFVNN